MLKSPMFATDWEGGELRWWKYGSPKFDGVRLLNIDGQALSRNFKPIPNRHVQELFGRREYHGLDGELIVGSPTAPDAYRQTMSGVMSRDGTPAVRLFTFDDFSRPQDPYRERLQRLAYTLKQWKSGAIKYVTQAKLTDARLMAAMEERVLAEGYEGLMVRDPDAPYKQGRSTLKEEWLLKVKRHRDGEYLVLGFEPLRHNANEMTLDERGRPKRSSAKAGLIDLDTLGALLGRDLKTGVEFRVGVGQGWTDEERARLWAVRKRLPGTTRKYKFFPSGSKDKPRFPVDIGPRDAIDL